MDKRDAIKLIQAKIHPLVDELDEVVSPLFATEWGKHAPLGALVLSGCILLYMVVSALTDWYHNFAVLNATKTASAISESNVSLLVAEIPKQHLFGEYGVVEKSARLPITSLQLDLKGIIKATPDSLSRVIISEGSKPGKVYQIGDALESGVKIYAITADSVVLENGGQFEKLPLRRTSPNFQAKFKPPIAREPAVIHNKADKSLDMMRPKPDLDLDDEEP